MAEKDFAVGVTSAPQVGSLPKKPCYLVTLDNTTGKTKATIYFVALDKPDLVNGFIQVKGFYLTPTPENIELVNFNEVMTSFSKDSIIDIMFPWHRVEYIKNLVFNPNKHSTLVK